MKITTILLFSACLSVSADGLAQKVTLSEKNVKLEKVFKEIKKQTGYVFFYDAHVLQGTKRISIDVKNKPLEEVLKEALEGQSLDFSIERKTITIVQKAAYSLNSVQANFSNSTEAISPPALVNIINGTVKDAQGNPLAGVSVIVKRTQKGASTNIDGSFTVDANVGDVLEFSIVGYQKKNVLVGQSKNITVVMEIEAIVGNEVVVVAYGKSNKSALTSAVSSIKGDKLTDAAVPNVANNLSGRLAGVLSYQTSGEPGSDETTIRIRGQNTLGNSQPLVIIDGIPGRLSDVNSEDIEDMSILKDAAAVAPYGLAAANGVILITTKQGIKGQSAKFSYASNFGIQNPVWLTKTINSYQQAVMRNEVYKNDHPGDPNLPYPENELEEYRKVCEGDPTGNYDKYYNSHNVRDIIRHDYPLNNQTLSVRGGSEKIRYFSSLGYTNQASMIPTENLKKIYGTVNLNIDVSKSLSLFLAAKVNEADRKWPSFGGQITQEFGIYGRMFEIPPDNPIWWPNTNGLWANGNMGFNPIGRIYTSGTSTNNDNNTVYTLGFEKRLFKGLSVKGTFNYRYENQFEEAWNQGMIYWDVDLTASPATYIKRGPNGKSKFAQSYSKSNNIVGQGFINYDNTFGQHRIHALFVAEVNDLKNRNFLASRQNYDIPIPTLDMGSSLQTDLGNGGSASEARQIGLVSKFDYSYQNKYLFGFSGRLDEHYYFAPGFRAGFFPAFSAGWRIGQEKFIKDNYSWINELKIRSSWGKSGNLAGGPFQYLSTYGVRGEAYRLGDGLGSGLYEQSPANTKITWEVQNQFDLGLDLNLWNGLLTFSADYFHQMRDNMLISPNVTLPGEYGIGLPQQNAGSMSNQGIEFTAGTTKEFSNGIIFQADANFTFARNKILNMFENPATYNDPHRRRTGHQIGAQFGLVALGYFKSDDEISKSPKQEFGYYTVGDLKYADINKDGKVDGADETKIGNPNFPECIFGLNLAAKWKGFDVSVLIQGATSSNIQKPGNMGGGVPALSNANTQIEGLDHWTPETPNAKFPRFSNLSRSNNYITSSWYERDGSYIRLKNFSIGYTLPAELMKKIKLGSVRFYVTGENMLTWTADYLNADPESAAGGAYTFANQKAASVGVNVTF